MGVNDAVGVHDTPIGGGGFAPHMDSPPFGAHFATIAHHRFGEVDFGADFLGLDLLDLLLSVLLIVAHGD